MTKLKQNKKGKIIINKGTNATILQKPQAPTGLI